MPAYPELLPLPDHVGYNASSTMAAKTSPVPSPANDQGVFYNDMRTVLNLTFHMDDVTLDGWLVWLDAEGWEWFDMPLVAPVMPVDITSTQTARCISDAQIAVAGYNWNTVNITVELLPGGTADPLAQQRPQIPDVVNPGAPAAPAIDIINPGTPDAPAIDRYVANIYYFKEA